MPKTSQRSDMNPGWKGPGIPTIRQIASQGKKSLKSIRQGKPEDKNRIAANLADLWNFYIQPFKKAECPCCGWVGKSFLATSNWRAVTYQSRCPQCDSRSRHRGLYNYILSNLSFVDKSQTLFFAPEKIILDALRKIGISKVITTDYNSVDVDFPGEDIQKLSFDSGEFELLICNHVLEHIPDDNAAIAECFRVLSSDGIALFTIPGDFHQNKTWFFDEPDSNGHFRHYGLDIVSKLEQYFQQVNAVDMSLGAPPSQHIRKGDYLFVCTKDDKCLT